MGDPVLVSCSNLDKTALVYLPGNGAMEQVALLPSSCGWMVGFTSTGFKVTSTLACDDPGEEPTPPQPAQQPEPSAEPLLSDARMEIISIDGSDPESEEEEEAPRSVSMSFGLRTPVCTQWRVALRTAPNTPVDLEVAFPEQVHVDEPDEVDVLMEQHEILEMWADATYKVPSHRLRQKTSPASARMKLAYKPGFQPVKKEVVVKDEVVVKKEQKGLRLRDYRIMYYINRHSLGIRQMKPPKTQVGSTKIPDGMTVDEAKALAAKVVAVMEQDHSLEPYCSDLLQMSISAMEI